MIPIALDPLQMGLSLAIPFIAAILNDPRPNRTWLRILVVIALTAAAALYQLWIEHKPITLQLWAQSALSIFFTNQAVQRLLGRAVGKVEGISGQGLGALVDALLRGKEVTSGGLSLDDFDAKKAALSGLVARGVLTQDEADEKLAALKAQFLGAL